MDGGAWWATVHGVAKSWTRLSDFTFTCFFCVYCLESYNKWMYDFVKSFSLISWDDHVAFIFHFVKMVCHIDWFVSPVMVIFCILDNPCIPEIKSTLSWCMIFLMCCSIQLARILSIFASMFPSDIGMWFSFLWHPCLVLVSGWWWSHGMNWDDFFLCNFPEEFEQDR